MNTLFKLSYIVAFAFITGCATYTTVQEDSSPDRVIKTRVRVSTFWDSNSKLADSKAIQTDKSQSASLGGLTQSATSTNVTAQLEILLKLAKELQAGGF